MEYQARQFNIPELSGISRQSIEEHVKLYEGYVKHVNHIRSQLDKVNDDYARAEMMRRLGFEFGGMRNHEYYFEQFQIGPSPLKDGKLKSLIEAQWGSMDGFVTHFKKVATTRGVGWAMMYLDRKTSQLVTTWVDEQHFGQLADLDIVLGLDMWEHSYMLDYPPSEKAKYIDAFFQNLNWDTVSKRV
jgi:Fe-Mn family superoxide dismutase